ncbi:ankyrin repeat domain-containing protein [Trifolium pratense]|uniref:Ankyrin repeat domain-containing protein n=2 Tax=Trifolium pratense TaxID=57577 RepID=A0A2K3L1Y6_TRIPR|nr:ankyrin repeat domain-containing protein [Trifolium pratense]
MGKGNPQKSGPGGDLHTAARSGDLIAVQSILFSNPLSVNSRDKHSRTPLHLAAFSGQTEVVSYLCKNKADVGASAIDDMAAIHFAAQKGHLEVVRALVSAGASFKSSTRKGVTPLHFAAQGSHLELVKYLAKKGASLTIKTKAGKTPLDLATNDEVRTFLEGFKKSDKNEESRNDDKAEGSDPKENEESDPKASSSLGSDGNLSSEPPAAAVDEEKSEREKRKSTEDDAREDSSQRKKAKVKLSHLQSSDDAQEEENLKCSLLYNIHRSSSLTDAAVLALPPIAAVTPLCPSHRLSAIIVTLSQFYAEVVRVENGTVEESIAAKREERLSSEVSLRGWGERQREVMC